MTGSSRLTVPAVTASTRTARPVLPTHSPFSGHERLSRKTRLSPQSVVRLAIPRASLLVQRFAPRRAGIIAARLLIARLLAALLACGFAPSIAAGQTDALSIAAANAKTPAEGGAGRVLTPTQRGRLVSDFRTRGPDQRATLAREMAGYRDLELTRFLAQHGLRDRTPVVVEAVQSALLASRGDPPHDALVLALWRAEWRSATRSEPRSGLPVDSRADSRINSRTDSRTEARGAKRPTNDYAQRLAVAVGNRRTFAAWTELARGAFEGEATGRGECLEALLAAIDRVGADRDLAALPALEQLAAAPWLDQSQGLRRSLVDAARGFDNRRATGLLIGCLERTDGEMRFAIAERLAALTGQKHGSDPAAWRAWWREQAVPMLPGAASSAGGAGAPGAAPPSDRGAVPAVTGREFSGAPLYYYDLPVRAQRVVFVLDVSKSMGLGGNTSRLVAAQRELTRTIGALADGTLFNVIVFHERVATWQDRLYPATPATRAHAAAFVRSQRPQGKTATYDALQAALSMSPTPEAIYFLSDGMPSTGEIVAPDRVLEAVRRDNQRLRVAIHALGTLAGPRDTGFADFLEQLAAKNYGQFRRLE